MDAKIDNIKYLFSVEGFVPHCSIKPSVIKINGLYLNKNYTYVLYWTHGILSYQVAKKMEGEGFHVMSLMDGIEKYHGKYI